MLDLASGTVLTLDGHPHTLYKEPQVTYPIPLLSPAISWAKSTFSIRQAAEYNMMRARENPEEGGGSGWGTGGWHSMFWQLWSLS
jgi:hypothetical protein